MQIYFTNFHFWKTDSCIGLDVISASSFHVVHVTGLLYLLTDDDSIQEMQMMLDAQSDFTKKVIQLALRNNFAALQRETWGTYPLSSNVRLKYIWDTNM